MKFMLLLVAAWLSMPWVAQAASIGVTGEVTRGVENAFTARVTLSNLTTAQLGTMTEQQFVESRVYVILETYDNLKVPFITAQDDALALFDEVISHDIEFEEHDIVVDIEIRSNKTLDLFKNNDGDIIIGACLRRVENGTPSTSCEEDADGVKVSVVNIVVNDAPTKVSMVPMHLQTTVKWNVESFPNYTNELSETITNRAASGVIAVLVKADGSVTSLEAREFLGGARNDDTETLCTFNESAADGSACVTCPANNYLDFAAIKESTAYKEGSIKLFELGASKKEAAFVGLEEDVTYRGFVTYTPDALQRSACYSAVPYKGLSWTELNGGTDAKQGVPCFVATAAYGSPMANEIDDLRWFRGKFLMTNGWGRVFVKAYYKYGPYLAAYIEKTPERRAATRVLLWPMVKMAKILRFVFE